VSEGVEKAWADYYNATKFYPKHHPHYERAEERAWKRLQRTLRSLGVKK
jgi:hypothetical protein